MLKIAKNAAEAVLNADLIAIFSTVTMFKESGERLLNELKFPSFAKFLEKAKPSGKSVYAETMASDGLRHALCLLPEKLSHHNSPTRRTALYQSIAELQKDAKKIAIVVMLEDHDHMHPLTAAVVRATQGESRKKNAQEAEVSLLFVGKDGRPLRNPQSAETVADIVRWVCRTVDTPPSELTPKSMSEQARKRFKGLPNVSVSEFVGQKLLTLNCGGIHAVGKAANEEPRMLIFDYHPKGAKRTAVICGKGVTFDTGGLSIKISGGMNNMKADMAGAAAVFGAFELLVRSGFKHRVVAVGGLVENAVSPESMKPDDILLFHSGKTVEINNTDAEGRLVLGDCLSYACREYSPEVAIDAATLTGAQLVATGKHFAAIISNDDRLERIALESGRATGELTAALPFAPEIFQDEFKSKMADMKNSVADRNNAQTSCAAQFIFSHIDDLDIDWLHIDLAGPSFIADRATGFGTLLIADTVERYFKRDRNPVGH
jgi:probable aminopeptidase NPEPL1